MSRYSLKATFGLLLLATLAAVPVLADGVKQAQFPQADQYLLRSEPKFLVKVGDSEEIVTCRAELRLQTGPAYVTSGGKRRVDLVVVDWKAEGTSKLLGGPLRFRMIKDGSPVADKSFVESYALANAKGSRDFPAHAQFVVRYELQTPFGVVSDLYGVTSGTIEAFPPQPGALFKLEKGDIAKVMAELMPEPLMAMTATGEVVETKATIEPVECEDVGEIAQ